MRAERAACRVNEPRRGATVFIVRIKAMTARKTAIDPKLLEMLVCPLTKRELKYDAEAQELISESAGLAYPIREGIPIMLVDEARRLDAPAKGRK
jgi:hypothetical protein